MPKSLKFFLFLAAIVAFTLEAQAQPADTQLKNWMFATETTNKTDPGVFVNDITCEVIAKALNDWAAMPPVTPLKFVCRAEPKKS